MLARGQNVFGEECGEVVRQETLSGCSVGSHGKLREYPAQIRFGIHMKQLTGAENRIQHRGTPAGVRVTNCYPVFSSDLGRAENVLHRVLIDVDVPIANFRVHSQTLPTIIGVRHGVLQSAFEFRRVLELEESLLDPPQDWLSMQMPIMPTLLMSEHQAFVRAALDSVQLSNTFQDRCHLHFMCDHRRQGVTPQMSDALEVAQERHIRESAGIPGCPIRLHIAFPLQREELELCFLGPHGLELQIHGLFVRGEEAPEVGIVRATSALGVFEFSDGFIDLQIAAAQDLPLQLLGDRDQEVRGILDDAAQRLTRDVDALPQADALLAVQRQVIGVLCRIRDYADSFAESAQSCGTLSIECGIVWVLQLVQERQQLACGPVFSWLAIDRCRFCQDLLSQREIRIEVHLSSLDRLVAEPKGDRRLFNTRVEQVHGHRVSQAMESDPPLAYRRASVSCVHKMLVQKMLNCISTKPTASDTWKNNLGTLHARLVKPRLEGRGHGLAKWHGALFATLPNDLEVRGPSESQVLPGQTRHFGEAQSGLNGQQHQSVVTTARPRLLVGRAEKGLDLGPSQKSDQSSRVPFARRRKHTLDLRTPAWQLVRDKSKERTDGREPQVPCSRTHASAAFHIVQERRHKRRVNLFDAQLLRCRSQLLLSESQQDLNVSRYEQRVCGLTFFCCIKRCVKNRCNRTEIISSGPSGYSQRGG